MPSKLRYVQGTVARAFANGGAPDESTTSNPQPENSKPDIAPRQSHTEKKATRKNDDNTRLT